MGAEMRTDRHRRASIKHLTLSHKVERPAEERDAIADACLQAQWITDAELDTSIYRISGEVEVAG
jgi:hypothetical protein